jgi:hypothetical protein
MKSENNEIVTRVMEPVLPGTYAVLTVGHGTDATHIHAFALPDGPTDHPREPVPSPVAHHELPVVQRTEECFTVDVPEGELHLWAIQATPEWNPATAWYANQPRLFWNFPEQPEPGGDLRIIGRNLVRADRYPTTDPRQPVSFGGRLDFLNAAPSQRPTRACLRPAGGGAFTPLTVRTASGYEATVEIPAALEPGEYEVYLHNGLGGAAGWSEPLRLTVQPPAAWPETVFDIETYLKQPSDPDEAFAAALADIEKNGGGILALGPYTYLIRRTLVLPRRTILRGAGNRRTQLFLPFNLKTAAEPPFVAITGEGDFVVEDLRIDAVHAPVLICAPQFTPVTQDEAAQSLREIGKTDRRARNVTIRRCVLEQEPFRQSDRRKDFDPRGWMKAFGENGWATLGKDGYCGIYLKGDRLVVEDCRVIGAGTAIALDRCSHARISRNVLQAGFFGGGLGCNSRLTWEKGVGARIKGNETRRILVEDNDVSARSEFARGLVAFNYGGDELHVARNHIHDISPYTDSEALLTHLWQARWKEPTIRMAGPTTAEIVDPTGEVAHEWLEGAWLDIVEGTGMGQLRQILRREGNRIEIDQPWRTDPDATSNVVFTAPAPFRNLNLIDNHVASKAINIIIWGTSYNVMADGNQVAEGRGLSVWSIRLAADQKVWGGAVFTSFINNTADRCHYPTPARQPQIQHAVGLFNIMGQHATAVADGYDFLGLIMRSNYAVNNTGIGFRKTFHRAGWATPRQARDAGVVVERNHVADSLIGIVLEKGARVVERNNSFDQVEFPLTWVEPEA